MSDSESIFNLPVLQQWMQLVITHPDGVQEGIESDAAQQHLVLRADELESVISRSQQLTSLERLQIYGNAYYARLIDCMGEEFPALKHALGEEPFASFVFAYLQQYPSTSYTLDDLGRNFPTFLSETRPDDTSANWPQFLIDLATLERTYADVFDGEGVEDKTPLDVQALASIPPSDWERLRLIPAPCLRLLEFDFPVHLYATAVKNDESPAFSAEEKTWLVIFRSEYIVRRRAVDAAQFRLLQRLVAGDPLGRALETLLAEDQIDEDELPGRLRDWFTFWAKWRFFSEVRLEQS
ncbi:MAG: hypothetical protein CMJ46_11400 [Planctomyces sp.]|nr:hypothetical protein [Planctomyces sp.]